jgi:thiaminase (transcriptional activator TenA)
MSLFGRLQEEAAPIRGQIRAHPFIQSLGDGSLAPDRYRYYPCQDYVW